MSTSKKNVKKEVRPEGQTPEGMMKANNPADGKAIIYRKPSITLINKPSSIKKVDSTTCAICDGFCQTCDICDGYCVACDGCDVCDAGCDICDGCEVCVGCDGCDICVGCDVCDAGCDICVGCDVCDAGCDICVGCDGCDGCVGCDSCDACVGCVTGDASLPVTLTTFNLIRKKNSVLLCWRTESEVNNLGFFLFKALDKNGPFEPVNTKIIPGAGSTSEAHDYEYVDSHVDNSTTYWYMVEDVDINGETTARGPIECKPLSEPKHFRLSTNYPNPFNEETSLSITVPENGQIDVDIIDVSGRTVRKLLKGTIDPGTHPLTWDARNNRGAMVPSGTYICRVRFDYNGEPFTVIQKMSYIR